MNEETRSDEVSVLDIFNVMRRYKWLILALPVVAAVFAALLVSYVLRPTWEASATLEVGRVGGSVVEPAIHVMSRMKLPSSYKGVVNSGLFSPEEVDTAQGFYGTLKIAQVKGVDLIEVKVRAPSPEMAKNLIQGGVVNLQRMQKDIMAVTIEKNKKQLQILIEDIKIASADTELLKKKLLASHNWNAFDATLTATLLKDKTADLRAMIQAKLVLEEQLSPARTFPTKIIDEIYVSEGPVSPNKRLIIGLAMLAGLFGAMFIAFVHNAITSSAARVNS